MSKETIQWLNEFTLVGFTEKRGNAWHFSDSHQGELSNHYAQAVPVADVERRLFNWEPVKVPVEYTIDGVTRTSSERFVVARSDNGLDMGVFKDGYQPHSYKEWLLGVTSNIIGDTLSVGSAGLLRNGAQAWVSIEVPENITTPEGVVFRPHLLAVTSLDGSLATTYKRVVTNVVCDNTMSAALGERSGEVYKLRHTRNSGLKVQEAREALAVVETVAEDFMAEVATLHAITVSDKQWGQFLDIHFPVPAEGKGKAHAERKREEITELYSASPMVSPWKGTAYGVVQAVNTHVHHVQTVRGMDRAQSNWSKAVKGEHDNLDANTITELNKVLANA
jgi:phage/plasmid-like protein (TIGR03299 family)